jgi:hypothetical protein
MEVSQMKRVLFILFGLMVAMTVTGLAIAFTRPIKWPENVGPLDWRRTFGEKAEETIEEAAA